MNRRLTMLVVDDLEINRASFCAIFEDQYEVLEACDGKIALEILRAGNVDVDVVVLDLYMPVLNGYDVIGQMKSDMALRDIPIIVKTAVDEESEAKLLEMGVDDFIFSPCDPVIIKHRVKNAVQKYIKWQDDWHYRKEAQAQMDMVRSALAAKEVKSLRATMQEIVALCREGAKEGADEVQKHYCAIDTQATDALTMINNFIETSGSYGEVQVNAHSFQIQGIVADITREYTMACRGKGIHFSIETRELPYENLRGDSRRIKQIWSNMLEKAYYHTEKGGRIKTRYGEQVIDEQHVNIEITVESNGVVGEKYTLTKGLVEVMHGTLHISYDENSGSRITARVPVEVGKNPQTRTKDFGNRRVLIFDDNSVTSSYHAAIISRLGISCEVASSLAEALCFMGEAYDEGNSYDICMLNWYMAGARECIAALKSSCMRGGMEIACSTNEKERMEPKMRECGVDYVVERPVYQTTMYHFFSELFRT